MQAVPDHPSTRRAPGQSWGECRMLATNSNNEERILSRKALPGPEGFIPAIKMIFHPIRISACRWPADHQRER
jgi:hypothetical protein